MRTLDRLLARDYVLMQREDTDTESHPGKCCVNVEVEAWCPTTHGTAKMAGSWRGEQQKRWAEPAPALPVECREVSLFASSSRVSDLRS